MDLDEVAKYLSSSGGTSGSLVNFKIVSVEDLKAKSISDEYSDVVLKALHQNSDLETPLYLHQFKALHAKLVKGKNSF